MQASARVPTWLAVRSAMPQARGRLMSSRVTPTLVAHLSMPTVKGPASSSSLRWREVAVAACVCRGCREGRTNTWQQHVRGGSTCGNSAVSRCNNSVQVHQQCGLHCSTVSAENDRTRSAPARLVIGCGGGMPYGEMAACGRSTDATERPERLVRVWRVGGSGGQGGGWPRMRRGCCRGASAGAAAGAAAGAVGAGEGRTDAVCGRGLQQRQRWQRWRAGPACTAEGKGGGGGER